MAWASGSEGDRARRGRFFLRRGEKEKSHVFVFAVVRKAENMKSAKALVEARQTALNFNNENNLPARLLLRVAYSYR